VDGHPTPNQTSKFEVEIVGDGVVFSKLGTNRFPTDEDIANICAQIAKKLNQ